MSFDPSNQISSMELDIGSEVPYASLSTPSTPGAVTYRIVSDISNGEAQQDPADHLNAEQYSRAITALMDLVDSKILCELHHDKPVAGVVDDVLDLRVVLRTDGNQGASENCTKDSPTDCKYGEVVNALRYRGMSSTPGQVSRSPLLIAETWQAKKHGAAISVAKSISMTTKSLSSRVVDTTSVKNVYGA